MRPRPPILAASGTLLSRLVLSLLLVAPLAARAAEPSDTVRVSKGRVSYNLFCKSCHGEWAKGDGSAAQYLKVPPPDLTRITARHDGEFPFDEIYQTIDGREVRHYGSDMPVWGNALQETEETDDEAIIREKVVELVYYLKSIQERTPAAVQAR